MNSKNNKHTKSKYTKAIKTTKNGFSTKDRWKRSSLSMHEVTRNDFL